MTQRKLTFAVLAALALAACQQTADDSNIAIDNGVNAAEAAEADIEALPPSETGGEAANSAVPLSEAEDGGSEGATIIPAQYRGRWGLVAADCTSTRGDNKGLITIADTTIKFYESIANLKERRPAIATSFSGLYGFAGEGQTWEGVETLTRTGDRLERRSTAPQGEAGDALTYTRCKA